MEPPEWAQRLFDLANAPGPLYAVMPRNSGKSHAFRMEIEYALRVGATIDTDGDDLIVHWPDERTSIYAGGARLLRADVMREVEKALRSQSCS